MKKWLKIIGGGNCSNRNLTDRDICSPGFNFLKEVARG